MSKCLCQSALHNHVAGECPNEVGDESSEKCESCEKKDKEIRLGGISEFPTDVGPPPVRNLEESLTVVPPDKPDQ